VPSVAFSNILLRFRSSNPDDARRLLNVVISSAAQLSQMMTAVEFCRLSRHHFQSSRSISPPGKTDRGRTAPRSKTAARSQNWQLPNAWRSTLLKQVLANFFQTHSNFLPTQKIRPSKSVAIQAIANTPIRPRQRHRFRTAICRETLWCLRALAFRTGIPTGTALTLDRTTHHQRHGGRIWAEAELNQGATFFSRCLLRRKRAVLSFSQIGFARN